MPIELLQPPPEVGEIFKRGMDSFRCSPSRDALGDDDRYEHLPPIPLYGLSQEEVQDGTLGPTDRLR